MAVLPERVQEILRECLRDPREEEEKRLAGSFGSDLAWEGFASSQRIELQGQVRGTDEQMEELGRQAEALQHDGGGQPVGEVRLGDEVLVRFPEPQTVESLLAGNALLSLLAAGLPEAKAEGPHLLGPLLERVPVEDVERFYYACLLYLGRQVEAQERNRRLEGLLAQMGEMKERKRALEEDLAQLGIQKGSDGPDGIHQEEAESDGTVNRVILVGRLGCDPQVRQTSGGRRLCTFPVATSHRADGRQETEWHQVAAWEELADSCGKYLGKGRLVYVEGKLRWWSWGEGEEQRRRVEVVAERVVFLGSGQPRVSTLAGSPEEEGPDELG